MPGGSPLAGAVVQSRSRPVNVAAAMATAAGRKRTGVARSDGQAIGRMVKTSQGKPDAAREAGVRRTGMAMTMRGAALALGLSGILLPAIPAQAQMISQPVVQPLPDRRGVDLNEALTRLGRNPRDVQALIDAGNAALVMGDVDAATGFFKRAEQIAPSNARAKAGLAGAYVRGGNPYDAIPLFEAAEKAGSLDGSLAADRGLAYDLVGDNESAQRFYRIALARGDDAETTRRLALSQAIAGDKKGSEATLLPLLRVQDKAAWRTRAFALAILGDPDQAVSISKTILPPHLAEGIAPYLRYMPKLTPAQQAAAANFGTFPRASEIGRDDPRVARYAPAGGRRVQVATADSGLVPQGQPLGKAQGARQSRQERQAERRANAARQSRKQAARVAPPDVQPAIVTSQPAARTPAPSQASAPQAPAPPKTAQAELPPVSARPAPVAQTPAAVAQAVAPLPSAAVSAPAVSGSSMSGTVAPSGTARPGFDLAGIAARQEGGVPQAPASSASAPASPPARLSLAEAFREFGQPATDATPTAGAVDIRRITPARPRPAEPAKQAEKQAEKQPPKPPPPSHPSRIWVQMATGRDKSALAFDWRRMSRQAADAMKDRQSYVSAWGQTNRLLTGPFESERAATAFITQLARGGISGPFVWTSPAGQVVDRLGGK